MAKLITIHPGNPQPRLIEPLARVIDNASVVVLPTDSGYSLCCQLGQKLPLQRICRIRHFDERHFFTLLCRDLSEISRYAKLDNTAFRFVKSHTPAPITFVLPATKEVAKQLLQTKRKTIGVRIPQNKILMALLTHLDQPLMSVSVDEFPDTWPVLDPTIIAERYDNQVDSVIDGGIIPVDHSTVVDLSEDCVTILRQGSYEI